MVEREKIDIPIPNESDRKKGRVTGSKQLPNLASQFPLDFKADE